MYRFIAVLCLILGFAPSVEAQMVDHWSTSAECMAASNAPLYHPSMLRAQKLGPDEAIRGHPTGGCFEMDLPDRLGGKGFVRVEVGREFVYNLRTGQVLRLAACNNHVYSWTGFAPASGLQGPMGPQGPAGPQGPQGNSGQNAQMDMTALVAAMFQRNEARPRRDWGWLKKVGIGAAIVGTGFIVANNWPRRSPRNQGPGGSTGPAF